MTKDYMNLEDQQLSDNKIIINQALKQQKITDLMHSSVFAAAQNGSSFGATSNQTYAERRALDKYRKYVKRYNRSELANRLPTARPKREEHPLDSALRQSKAVGSNTQRQRGADGRQSR